MVAINLICENCQVKMCRCKMHITFTLCLQPNTHPLTHSRTHRTYPRCFACCGISVALCPAVRGTPPSPPPWHLARWQTNITAATTVAVEGEMEGGRRGPQRDTSSRSLWPQKGTVMEQWETRLNYLALFLPRWLVFTCTYTQTHVRQRVWKRQGEYSVYTWIYSIIKNNLTVGVHNLILFFVLRRRAETSNASFQLLIMLHADDIATSVTDTYYYYHNMYSNDPMM